MDSGEHAASATAFNAFDQCNRRFDDLTVLLKHRSLRFTEGQTGFVRSRDHRAVSPLYLQNIAAEMRELLQADQYDFAAARFQSLMNQLALNAILNRFRAEHRKLVANAH